MVALPILALVVATGALIAAPAANADHKRLNDSVFANIYTVQQ
jgi:hypothetical protein